MYYCGCTFMFYGWSRGDLCLKNQISLVAETAVSKVSAMDFSFSLLHEFPEENTAPANTRYIISATNTSVCFQVASFDASICQSMSFSFTGEIYTTRFFCQKAVASSPWVLLADTAALNKLNFTVAGLGHSTAAAQSTSVRPEVERKVFFNSRIYLNKGVLRL